MSLAHEILGSGPRVVMVCHGILGSRRNWRSFCRSLVAALPGWRAVLVDLRGHGDSSALGPPYTVARCGADLADLAQQLGVTPEVVVGHSFGGKVVLSYTASLPAGLQQTWVLDATPGPLTGDANTNEVAQVIAALKQVPPMQHRTELVDFLTGRGFSMGLARWMTTNLHRTDAGMVWRFDLTAIEALITDYFALDLWDVLETPVADLEIHVVRALRSARWSDEILARFDDLSLGSDVTLHDLASGHWVHVDAPAELLEMMVDHWVS